jgi:hypothetical protein
VAGIQFLLDEDLRGQLWKACQTHNEESHLTIDVLRVGDAGAPPRGTKDPELLLWIEAHDRILVSRDKSTMPQHLKDHWDAGHSVLGVLLLRPKARLNSVLEYMVTIAHPTDATEWVNQLQYII